MCGPSLRKVGQGVLKLLIGNEKVTDGQTDICKAICPLFFEEGIMKQNSALANKYSRKVIVNRPISDKIRIVL